MLDVHALSSGGGTVLTDISTIALGNDGQATAGVPIRPDATLRFWGGMTTIADTIREFRILSLDQVDPQNAWYFILGASSVAGIIHGESYLPFVKARRLPAMRQNTAGANNLAYLIDQYPIINKYDSPEGLRGFIAPRQIITSQLFAAALTAITWGTVAFAPTTPLPTGRYAILGAWVNALTNYGVVRFQHADFGGLFPGFPVQDHINTAVARAVDASTGRLFQRDGYQFLLMGDVPEFRITAAGSGLTIWAIAITADTPNVTLNLVKLD